MPELLRNFSELEPRGEKDGSVAEVACLKGGVRILEQFWCIPIGFSSSLLGNYRTTAGLRRQLADPPGCPLAEGGQTGPSALRGRAARLCDARRLSARRGTSAVFGQRRPLLLPPSERSTAKLSGFRGTGAPCPERGARWGQQSSVGDLREKANAAAALLSLGKERETNARP